MACSTVTPIHLKIDLPIRPSKPPITAIDQGDFVALSKADFTQLTQYLILSEAYIDALELVIEENTPRM